MSEFAYIVNVATTGRVVAYVIERDAVTEAVAAKPAKKKRRYYPKKK
jgi:type IV secretory pathway TrbF-like protein